MSHPERSPERDAALLALLDHVPIDGWTSRALRAALQAIGQDPADADLLFPGGPPRMIEAYIDLADRWMEQDAAAEGLDDLRTPQRVRAVIALRFARNRPYKEAIRRAFGVFALPRNAPIAAACTARTVDSIWHAAGDRSADFSWYTKRALLTGVYGSTLLYWLNDPGGGDLDNPDQRTLAFLDRRLAGIARIGKIRKRADAVFARLMPGRDAA